MSKGTCAGCDKTTDVGAWGADWLGEIAPGRHVELCGGRYRGDPKVSCWDKAQKKLRACPGCGETGTVLGWRPGLLCDKCHRHLEEGQKANLAAKLVKTELKDWAIVDPNLKTRSTRELWEHVEPLLEVLARAVTGRGADVPDRRRSGAVVVEVTAEQAEAVKALSGVLSKVVTKTYETGRADGRSFVAALGLGQVSYSDLAEEEQR